MTVQVPVELRSLEMRCVRVGVALQSWHIPAWQHLALEKVTQCDHAQLASVILIEGGRSHAGIGAALLRRAFEWQEARRKVSRRGPCEMLDATALLSHVPVHRLSPKAKAGAAPRQTLEEIRGEALDVIVLLSDADCIDGLSAVARYGVWYYQHDAAGAGDAAGTSAGLWEVLTRQPCVKSMLRATLANEPCEITLQVSYSAIDHCCFTRTRCGHLWKSASFLVRGLRELAEHGDEALSGARRAVQDGTWVEPAPGGWGSRRTRLRRTAPTRRGLVRRPVGSLAWTMGVLRYLLWRLYMKMAMRIYRERWILLFDFGGQANSLSDFQKLIPPPDRFWADPHVVQRDGRYYVFIEEAPLATRRGHISVLRHNEDGSFGAPVPVIQRPYHLSYPFIFEWRGELFLMPESSEHRTIEVYRCKRFPEEWELECVLMENVAAVDSTLVQHQGRWWLFTSIKENDGAAWDELFVFHAESPLTRHWQPHARNPVVSDVRCARLAGALYHEGPALYRPSQDGSYRYGYGVRLNRVEELTPQTYREVMVQQFAPGWDRSIRAVHSFSRNGHLTMIDGMYRHRRERATHARTSRRVGVGRLPLAKNTSKLS